MSDGMASREMTDREWLQALAARHAAAGAAFEWAMSDIHADAPPEIAPEVRRIRRELVQPAPQPAAVADAIGVLRSLGRRTEYVVGEDRHGVTGPDAADALAAHARATAAELASLRAQLDNEAECSRDLRARLQRAVDGASTTAEIMARLRAERQAFADLADATRERDARLAGRLEGLASNATFFARSCDSVTEAERWFKALAADLLAAAELAGPGGDA